MAASTTDRRDGTGTRPDPWQAAKAMSHPLRFRIQAVLIERPQASPNELSKLLEEPLTNVSYHVRQMHEHNLLELVDTEPRRGALEHYYRLTAIVSVDVLPPPAR